MASIFLDEIGLVRRTEALIRPFPLSTTYVELISGVCLVASVNSTKDQCCLELIQLNNNDSNNRNTKNFSEENMTFEDERILVSIRANFRTPRVLQILEEEGTITAIELVRDYKKQDGNNDLNFGKKRSLDSLYVHLFIGTSNGTVLICNALRGTIMTIARFKNHKNIGLNTMKSYGEDKLTNYCLGEAIVRFVVHFTSPDARLNANIAQGITAVKTETIDSISILHSKGRVALLNRISLDIFINVALNRLDGKRPYLAIEWSPESNISTFPTAGPASHFASYVDCIFLMKEIDYYSSVELQTINYSLSSNHIQRSIRDGAFYFSCKGDTTAILRNGPQAMGALLICGEMPALSLYTFENTRPAFSTRETVKAVVSVLSGMAKRVWWGSQDNDNSNSSTNLTNSNLTTKPKPLSKKPQNAKDAFFEADIIFDHVQIDPSSQWAACYSENTGRIYIYDLMGGNIYKVMKGCRAAEFQWIITYFAGKRILLLVVHLLLRHAIEIYSLRLGKRVAARHVPQGSILLRPETSLSNTGVLLLTKEGKIIRLKVELDMKEEGKEKIFSVSSLQNIHASIKDRLPGFKDLMHHDKTYRMMPYDILISALNLPLPDPVTDEIIFTTYNSKMKDLENLIKTQFSPGLSDNRCLTINLPLTVNNIPRDITASQCLNYLELQISCVSNYRRSLLRTIVSEGDEKNKNLSSSLNNGILFSEQGELHPLLEQAICNILSEYSNDFNKELLNLIENILPSIQRLIRTYENNNLNKNSNQEINSLSINIFINFFNFGGYKLEFLRNLVEEYECKGDKTCDVWSEIGAIFYGNNRGINCLENQLENFSALGFQTIDVAILSLSWLSRSFAYNPKSLFIGSFSSFIYLLKTCNDSAFITGIEYIPCLTKEMSLNSQYREASILFMIICMIIRQKEKPISKIYYNRYINLLRQFLALKLLFNQCESLITENSKSLSKNSFKQLRMIDLLPREGGDTLNAYFLKIYSNSFALTLCENIMGNDNLKKLLAGVEIMEILKLIYIRDENIDWTLETPWYKDGTWNHELFLNVVLHPLISAFTVITIQLTQEKEEEEEEEENEEEELEKKTLNGKATPQQLSGLTFILIVGLIILERELKPLREEPLRFLKDNLIPDANLFEGSENTEVFHLHHPRGSRSTRDYFKSCRELLNFNQKILFQLLDQNECINCEKIHESILCLLSEDDNLVFPLIPVIIRFEMKNFILLVKENSKLLLNRLQEASSFIDTIIFFAFTETGTRSSSPLLPNNNNNNNSKNTITGLSSSSFLKSLSISWTSMYEDREVMLHLLPSNISKDSLKEDLTLNKIKSRSTLLNHFVFTSTMNMYTEERSNITNNLCKSLGLSNIIYDMPQIVLFDAAARNLLSNDEVNRLLNNVTNRHLAAYIAAVDFRIIVFCCLKYYTDMKKNIPKDNRMELQRLALKIQSMHSLMSEECRTWIHIDIGKKETNIITIEDKKEKSLPVEYQLVACSGWYTFQDFRLVENKVRERLQLSRATVEFLDFKALLLTLATVAAEGDSLLTGTSQCVLAELPNVAIRLCSVI